MIEYKEDWIVQLFFRAECRIAWRALSFALPAALFAVAVSLGHINLEELIESSGLPSISDEGSVKKPAAWTALIGCIILLLDFRQSQALARFWEGTSLLHQMRGEWFDSVSCLVTFAMLAVDSKPKEVQQFRHTVVRLMSHCHGSALEEIADCDSVIPRLDCDGIDPVTRHNLRLLKELYGFNRIEMVLKGIYTVTTKALDDGLLKIPPPILTRVYQTISRGFVCILNAKKITDTRFPFPFAQLIAGMLLLLEIAIPCLMAMLIRNPMWAGVFTFVPIFGLFSLNFIAIELENPFGQDDNDLPLAHFQAEMNNSLLMLLHGNVDHVASVSPAAVRDFRALAKSMGFAREQPSPVTRLTSRSSHVSSFEHMDFEVDNSLTPSEPSAIELALDETPKIPEEPEIADLTVRRIVRSMVDFNRSLQAWSQTLDLQVGELRRYYGVIKGLSQTCVEADHPTQSDKQSAWRQKLDS